MVGPSHHGKGCIVGERVSESKAALRARLRLLRRQHAAGIDPRTAALVLRRPPRPVEALVPREATVALYVPAAGEAPTAGYADWAQERGHRLALPWFADRDSRMTFRAWTTPQLPELLVPGPFGPQPAADAEPLAPQVLFVPMLGFTADGCRLGQGGGHYDRWLAENPGAIAIGLGWDVQLVEDLPVEPHDVPLRAVVTPTRLYGPFA